MQTVEDQLDAESIDSEADFVLFAPGKGILSEHCTAGEAAMAYYQEAGRQTVGDHMPLIFRRQGDQWVAVT